MRHLRYVLLLILIFNITSCGFHLRGPMPLPPTLHDLYLKTADPYGELTRNVRNYLKLSGIHLTDAAETATAVLQLFPENTSQQLLSVSGTQQTRQYNLILTLVFQVTDPQGRILIPPQTLTQTRTITIEASQILGGSNEANSLYQQMRQAIVFDLMNRLASADLKKLLIENATL